MREITFIEVADMTAKFLFYFFGALAFFKYIALT